jgi:hypothetical protein
VKPSHTTKDKMNHKEMGYKDLTTFFLLSIGMQWKALGQRWFMGLIMVGLGLRLLYD